jgi:hypothetical protein
VLTAGARTGAGSLLAHRRLANLIGKQDRSPIRPAPGRDDHDPALMSFRGLP